MLLWSKRPWSVVDPAGSEALPSGRLVAGITQTDLGPLTVVGVCIPWRDAHVRTGRKDRDPWQDHESWLSGFETLPYVDERMLSCSCNGVAFAAGCINNQRGRSAGGSPPNGPGLGTL